MIGRAASAGPGRSLAEFCFGSLLILIVGLSAGSARAADSQQSLIKPWDSFYSVAFVRPNRWYVVGASGAFLTSTDEGHSWNRRELAKRGDLSWFDLFTVRFANDGLNGWIGGERGIVLHTTDGGKTWQPQKSGVADDNIFRIDAIDAQRACGVGTNGLILTTINGGETWQMQRFPGGFTFFDVAFGDEQNGWLVGEFETILHTPDGGKTWGVQRGAKRANFTLPAYLAVRFLDGQRGWVAGQGGVTLRTADGGKTWEKVQSLSPASVYAVTYIAEDRGKPASAIWMAGNDGTMVLMPLVNHTPPAVLQPTFFSINDVAFSGQMGIAVGIEGTIERTEDGGKHWQQVTNK